MKSRHKKLALIGGALVIFGIIVWLVLNALNSNIALFKSPTEVASGQYPKNQVFRIGGLVKESSLAREADGVTVRFVVTDNEKDVTVNYKGILPDLFKEGKGVVAQGKLTTEGTFIANEVLAKHDENYMPPEAAQAVGDAHARAAEKKAAAEAAGTPPKPGTSY
ncbi:cytochrome c maturation protein CcmE [Dechloromonas sp. A34]|uniref:cytochrome c maturation protein CcmE n=1 Tax=Dechloromonas sp. A34 TaxID=447588 RepID=UPI00224911F4|nr:cytochrome c maturation protein CcmE [Dechloromonas sp. A34]